MPVDIRTLQTRLRKKQISTASKSLHQTSDPISNDPIRLRLVFDYFTYQDASSWSHTFSDPEVESSLHRWGWLLWGLNNNSGQLSREQGLMLIKS